MVQGFSVSFLNKEGLRLYGILHKPLKDRCKGKAILILSPGIKSRVAPHRLYVKMARRYVAMGFHVLRFDFSGLGDSEGTVAYKNVADFYGSIQLGKYVADTTAAMDWLEKEFSISGFVLAGLCGGAITGLLAGSQDGRVNSVIGLAVPVILDGANVDHSQFITVGQLEKLGKGYINKLFDIKSWLRLLTFKSDYKIIFKSITHKIMSKNHTSKNDIDIHKNSNAKSTGNFNTLFPQAFFAMLSSSRKILLIFGGSDRLGWEFEEKFAVPYREQLADFKHLYTLHTLSDANHILSFSEWQDEFFEITCNWLSNNCDMT